MKWSELFSDKNDINEKSIIGFVSFILIVITAIIDVVSNFVGLDFSVTPLIYQSLVAITLGAFGISEAGKVMNNRYSSKDDVPTRQTNIIINEDKDDDGSEKFI